LPYKLGKPKPKTVNPGGNAQRRPRLDMGCTAIAAASCSYSNPSFPYTIFTDLSYNWKHIVILLEVRTEILHVKGKGKAFPLQAWPGSWGARRLRLQNF
jgi:hypothetical protein